MRQIVIGNTPLEFDIESLPLAIHGKEGSGASFFSVVMAALICRGGNPFFFWSAYWRKKNLGKNLMENQKFTR